jgi:hypothetical protein
MMEALKQNLVLERESQLKVQKNKNRSLAPDSMNKVTVPFSLPLPDSVSALAQEMSLRSANLACPVQELTKLYLLWVMMVLQRLWLAI